MIFLSPNQVLAVTQDALPGYKITHSKASKSPSGVKAFIDAENPATKEEIRFDAEVGKSASKRNIPSVELSVCSKFPTQGSYSGRKFDDLKATYVAYEEKPAVFVYQLSGPKGIIGIRHTFKSKDHADFKKHAFQIEDIALKLYKDYQNLK